MMNPKLSLTVVALLLASPVLAQQEIGDALKEAGKAVAGKTNSNEARAGRVRGSISCGGEAVNLITQALDDNKVTFAFEARTTPSGLDGKVIKLDEKLPDAPRVLVAYAAQEASKFLFNDMPECAEKYYMRLSLTAQSWMELGGEAKNLPVLDKDYKDEKLGEKIRVWALQGSEFALEAAGKADKVDDLMALLDKEKDPAKIKTYKEANKRFTDFLYAESQFREMHAEQFKKK